MKITLDIRKSIDENAASYFEKAKKNKKKIDGVLKAISTYEKKLKEQKQTHAKKEKVSVVKKKKKSEWYEKFRWFISSDDLLVIGGRDATTNEIVIKKHADKNDLVFHTDMAGSPFVVIKRDKYTGDLPKATIEEAAEFTAVHSRGWKQGLSTLNVFSVNPDQVSKQAKAGEALAKGSFMIYGKTTYYTPKMSHAVGIYEDKVMGGPLSTIKKHCKEFIEIIQGNEKSSDVAKKIKKKIGGELDDILRALPPNCKIKK